MPARIYTLMVVLFCLIGSWAHAADDDCAKVDDLLGRYVETGYFHGAVLIARDGKVLCSKGYGMANLEHKVPNTQQTKFRIGSVSKQFTAMAILILHDQGKLNVSDTLDKYIETCPPAWRQVTLQHLVTHSGGIPNVISMSALLNRPNERTIPTTLDDLVGRFSDLPLTFQPGEGFKYSNPGYIILGKIIELT